jgi:hypothetical protein
MPTLFKNQEHLIVLMVAVLSLCTLVMEQNTIALVQHPIQLKKWISLHLYVIIHANL